MSAPAISPPTEEGTLYVCIAHCNPYFRLPRYTLIVKTRDFFHPCSSISLPRYLKNLGPGIALPEYIPDYSWIAIERLLHSCIGEIDRICIFLHRKFVSLDAGEVKAPSFPGMMLAAGSKINLAQEFAKTRQHRLLLPQILNVQNVEHHYAACHRHSDFIALRQRCIDVGILSDIEADAMSNARYLIPGGGLVGILPIELAIPVIKKMSRFSKDLLHKPYDPKGQLIDTYQSRAISFFMERLASFLTINTLDKIPRNLQSSLIDKYPNLNQGFLTTVSSGDDIPKDYYASSR